MTIASRRLSAAPARKAASASLSGAFPARAQAGNAAGEAVEGPGDCRANQRVQAWREATARRRFRLGQWSETAGLVEFRRMSDKVALSDIMLFIMNRCPRRGLWIAGKARQASILPRFGPGSVDSGPSLDGWTANLRSLDCGRRPAPRPPRNALIFLRSLGTASVGRPELMNSAPWPPVRSGVREIPSRSS